MYFQTIQLFYTSSPEIKSSFYWTVLLVSLCVRLMYPDQVSKELLSCLLGLLHSTCSDHSKTLCMILDPNSLDFYVLTKAFNIQTEQENFWIGRRH